MYDFVMLTNSPVTETVLLIIRHKDIKPLQAMIQVIRLFDELKNASTSYCDVHFQSQAWKRVAQKI